MKKLILLMFVLSLFITGCSSDSSESGEKVSSDNALEDEKLVDEGIKEDNEIADETEESKEEDKSPNISVNKLYDVPNEIGISSGNAHNYSLCVEQGDYVYYQARTNDYTNKEAEYSLLRHKKDGSETVELLKGKSGRLNVVGDWLYIRHTPVDSDDSGIYKIKLDGSDLTKLSDDTPSEMIVKGDWIYYKNYFVNTFTSGKVGPDDYNFYKMKTDGSELTMIKELQSAGGMENISISGDWIYYSYGDLLHRININDTSIQQSVGREILSPIIEGNTIYYASLGPRKLAKREILNNPMGNEETVELSEEIIIHSANSYRLNVYDGWVYFTSVIHTPTAPNGKYYTPICKVRTDGSDYSIVSDIREFESLCVVEGWIYYPAGTWLNRMRLDGSDIQSVVETD